MIFGTIEVDPNAQKFLYALKTLNWYNDRVPSLAKLLDDVRILKHGERYEARSIGFCAGNYGHDFRLHAHGPAEKRD